MQRVETPFPLLKRLTTHHGRHFEPFSGQKCNYIAEFCIYKLKKFSGVTPAEAPWVYGPRHQFPLGSPASPLFLFHETTIGVSDI